MVYEKNTKIVKFYLNGKYDWEGSIGNQLDSGSSTTFIGICLDITKYGFNGKFDEIMYYGRAIGSWEINEIYCAYGGNC
jgi:hypothetical protein